MERGLTTQNQNGLPVMGAGTGYIADFIPVGMKYTLVPASSNSALGPGAVGDYLGTVTIIPATTAPGRVNVADGGGTAMTIFPGGAGSVSNLQAFTVPFNARSTSGGWSINTSANVSVLVGGSSY